MTLNRSMVVLVLCAALVAAGGTGSTACADESPADLAKRLEQAREVYLELIQSPDRGAPEELRENCRCVGVFPHVIKAAIGVGGRYGKGIITCRDSSGWSPTAFYRLTGGSWGLQLGAEATDLVLFFMTRKSAASLLSSKFTLGARAGVAAGPLGRSAEGATDAKFNAEIYSYARSKGLFAGLSLEGARLAPSDADNAVYYGASVSAKQLLLGHKAKRRPAEMETFLQALQIP